MSDKMKEAIEWLKSGEGKPVIASRRTQERHDSEWQNPTVIAKGDVEGLKAALEEHRRFHDKYSVRKK